MTTNKLSLVQRLWLLLLLLVSLSIGGALIANLLNARGYLEQQLTAQSADTANSLALMLTQYKADPVMAQTLLNAAFDQGHFAEIRWEGAPGNESIRLRNQSQLEDTPAWFHRLLPLAPQAGMAQVSNGWLQAGRIVVVAHLGYAYNSLWLGALQTVLWLAGIGLFAGLLGFFDIRQLRRQLGAVVGQAHAISEQRFMRIPVPGIPELAEVARAMNHMVERLQNYLAGLREEVDKLRRDVLTDSSTGLPNRDAFDQRFSSLLEPQEDPIAGQLLLIRVAGLAELNQRLGGRKTDALLKRLADDLSVYCQNHQGWMATRLRGADFALLCPELVPADAATLADELCGLWPIYWAMELTDQPGVGHIGITSFQTGDTIGKVLGRANNVLTLAEAQPINSWKMDDGTTAAIAQSSDLDWRRLIESSCADDSLQLRWYPVCRANGEPLWNEGMLFRPASGDIPQMSALRLISHALRLGLVHKLDINTLSLALQHGPGGVLAVNMSPASLQHPDFLPAILQLLKANPERTVHFEFHETGLDEHWEAFIAFSRAVRPSGHRVAVEIQGHNMTLVARTHEASIAYLVLDNTLTQGVHTDSGRTALLRGLLQMASLMGVQLEAKGINNREDADTLIELGVHCLTGPAIG
ncbi:LapD/MoxY N-terminal periplasmic domain-containing protein [uncultured Aquitalea sp.]|uniref:bifunctional diguanylate cyclase/phosphodiesterase n=1 Tax=uncultured Aquitalea sp. TaxID=540272 RepID=UPI0025D05DA1|nr:LapD/MoxY N-terminal periplasmic domain-containing protein [uncultured Aquitalea sp.]